MRRSKIIKVVAELFTRWRHDDCVSGREFACTVMENVENFNIATETQAQVREELDKVFHRYKNNTKSLKSMSSDMWFVPAFNWQLVKDRIVEIINDTCTTQNLPSSQCVQILRELVDVKKIKDRDGKTDEYLARQKQVWQKAFEYFGETPQLETPIEYKGNSKLTREEKLRSYFAIQPLSIVKEFTNHSRPILSTLVQNSLDAKDLLFKDIVQYVLGEPFDIEKHNNWFSLNHRVGLRDKEWLFYKDEEIGMIETIITDYKVTFKFTPVAFYEYEQNFKGLYNT